ncbi:MAG: sodium:calcium antiporter, partial [Actinomycetota bacterium]
MAEGLVPASAEGRRAAVRDRDDGVALVGLLPFEGLTVAEGWDNPSMVWALLATSLMVILAGAELFTNGIEWIGESFGLSEGAVGSVLAAVGTALPETLLPLVAILSGRDTGEEIGTGAILGAPFMLTTLAMVVIGVAVLVTARGGRRSTDLAFDVPVLRQDLGYFLAMYALAVIVGLLNNKPVDYALVIVLLVGYVYYVRRHFLAPEGGELEKEAGSEIKPLYVWRALRRAKRSLPPWHKDESVRAPFVQVAIALGLIIGGAELFIHAVDRVAVLFDISPLAFSLLVAPIATELPEKFNSVIWVRRRKDTLALGNMTGAMVVQSSFPVTIGLLLTPWKLQGPALVAAVIALLAGGVLWLQVRFRGRLTAQLLLLQGVFYVGYVTYV